MEGRKGTKKREKMKEGKRTEKGERRNKPDGQMMWLNYW